MKKLTKILLSTITALTIILSLGVNSKTASAADQTVVTLGSSLTQNQRQGTIDTLTESLNGGSYKTINITGNELVKYLNPSGANFNANSGVWSSAMVQRTSSGSGINVKILKYNGRNNITTITANQYKNAALTAGISDANIYVTSATPIDGSGALAGVYAAFASNGEKLNQAQVDAAQSEMNTLSQITEDNKGKDGYTDAQLNNAVAGAKKEMAKIGGNVSDSQIADIINNQITINNLGDVINNNQKQQIINILINVRDSGALNSNNFKQQAEKVGDQIKSGAQDIFNKLNTEENRNFLQKIWDAIVNFFSNLFKQIQDMF